MIGAAGLDDLLVDPAFTDNPYPAYAQLRESRPVHWCEPWQAWVVTSHAATIEVLRQSDVFSSAGYELAMLEAIERSRPGAAPSLVAHYSTQVLSITDPPAHTRLRRQLVASFTPRVVERLRPSVEAIIEDLIRELAEAGEVDILSRFAYPLPALVIGELLGVPSADRDRFMRWSADIVAFVGTAAADPERVDRAERAMREFRESLRPLIAERRRRRGDDLLGLLAGPAPDEDGLSDDELVATSVTLLFAGHETTANLIGNGLLALLRHPEQLRLLRDRPALAEGAIEELLRFDSPVQRNRRRATRPVELAGERIGRNERVLAFLGAANRDPEVFGDPDHLDIQRPPGQHLAFGHGIHYCVGAALSRLEAPLAIAALLERYPRLELASGPIRWKPNMTFRGLEELRVRLS